VREREMLGKVTAIYVAGSVQWSCILMQEDPLRTCEIVTRQHASRMASECTRSSNTLEADVFFVS